MSDVISITSHLFLMNNAQIPDLHLNLFPDLLIGWLTDCYH